MRTDVAARRRRRCRRDRRDDVVRVGRSRPRARGAGARRRRLAARRRRVCRLGLDLRGGALVAGRRRARRLARRQPAQVAAAPDGLLAPLDRAARGVPGGVLARARVPAHAGGRLRALGIRAGARPALPLAQALGGAALLRGRGPAGDPPRAHPAGAALRRTGSTPIPTGSSSLRSASRSSFSAGTARTRRTRPSSSARTRAVTSFSRTRNSTAATSCGWQSATRARRRTTCDAHGRCYADDRHDDERHSRLRRSKRSSAR